MPTILESLSGLPLLTNPDASGITAALEVWPQLGATFRTNAGSAAPGQTLKLFCIKVALSAVATTTQLLEVVTTGKSLFLTDIYLSHDSAAVIETRIQAAGADIFRAPVKGDTAPVQLAGIESQPNGTSGQTVQVFYPIVATPPNAYINIGSMEQ